MASEEIWRAGDIDQTISKLATASVSRKGITLSCSSQSGGGGEVTISLEDAEKMAEIILRHTKASQR